MSEGDVSMIHDEDVLRKMWQQTDDFGRKKEIRAHMYRLREERLRSFYSSPEMDLAVTTSAATNRDATTKVGQFSSSTSHTDSFADQCFQSLKSKEVRDSESPTRDYTYKLQDSKGDHGGSWIVQKESNSSDNGHKVSQSARSQISGSKNIDGGKATFAGVNEQHASITTHEDENSKLRKDEKSSKSANQEHFIKQSNDGSLLSSSSQSSSKHFSSKTFQSTNNSDTVDFARDKTSIVDQDLLKNSINRKDDFNSSINNMVVTNNVETTLKNNEKRTIEQGELTSRKIEHPNENTTVITETLTLPDGTKVTSRTTETKGSTVLSTKSNTSSDHHSSHVENINESKSSVYNDKKSNVRNDFDNSSISGETTVKNIMTKNNEELKNIDLNEQKAYTDSVKSNEYFSKLTKEQVNNIKNVSQTSDINVSQAIKQDNVNVKVLQNPNKDHVTSNVNEAHEIKVSDENKTNKKCNDYTTTYQSDYTQKRITTDLSPTHQAWASTLRSDSPVPERKSPSRNSIRSSQSSLRSSQSPDKIFPKKSRPSSPDKNDRSSPFPTSSINRESVLRNKHESHKSSSERYVTRSQIDHKKNINDRHLSPERSHKINSTSHEKSPIRHPSPTLSNYSTDTYIFDKENKKVFEHNSNKQQSFPKISEKSPDRFTKKTNLDSFDSQDTYSTDKNSTKVIDFSNTTDRQTKSKSSERKQRSQSPSHDKYRNGTYTQNKSNHLESITKKETKSKRSERTPRYGSPSKEDTSRNNSSKHNTETPYSKPDSKPKQRFGSPTPYNVSLNSNTHKNTTNESSHKMSKQEDTIKSTKLGHENITYTPDSSTRHKSPESIRTKPRDEQYEFNRVSTTSQVEGDDKKKRCYKPSPSTSPTRSKPTSSTQSRDSSPTTSVSEIEYISTHKNSHIITDLDDIEHNIEEKTSLNIQQDRNGKETDSPKTTRPISPYKTTQLNQLDKVNTTLNEVKKPKERPPFIRSETYEERCRKILGMPDKNTLVKDAEKTLSEILSILPQHNLKSSDSSSVSPCSISPERETTPKTEILPKKILTEYPAQRKSSSPDRRVRINDTVNFISAEKSKDEENNMLLKNETLTRKDIEIVDIETSSRKSPLRDKPYQIYPHLSRGTSPDKTTKSNKDSLVTLGNVEIKNIINKDNDKSPLRTLPYDDTDYKRPNNSRSPSPEKKYKSPKLHTSDRTVENSSIKITKNIPDKSHHTSRSTSSEKLVTQTLVTQVTDVSKKSLNDISRTTRVVRTPSPSKSPIRRVSPEPYKNQTDKITTHKSSQKISSPQKDLSENKKAAEINRNVSPKQSFQEPKHLRNASPKRPISTQPISENKEPKSPTEYLNQRQTSPSKASPRKQLTEYPAQRKTSSDNIKLNKQSSDSSKTDINTSKSSSSTYRKTIKQTENRSLTSPSTKRTKEVIVDSSSDTEQERVPVIRRKSIDKNKHTITKTKYSSPSRSANENISKVFNNDLKITRTTSDLTIKPQHKSFPVRNKSKPEINVTRTSSSRSITKQTTITTTSKLTNQSNKTETTKPSSPAKLTAKPKSSTTINRSDGEDNIIIDIQHAKSSRENSPDKLCPLPVGPNEETGNLRLPDQVSEPDDDKPKLSKINTIHESDSVASLSDSKIVEVSDTEYFHDVNDSTSIHEKTETDEAYLLSVNQKVSKFLIEAEKLNEKPSKDDSIKHTVKSRGFDDKHMDDSLLSVSDKVSKFLAAADKFKADKPSERTPIIDEQYNINITSKTSLFSKTKDINVPVSSTDHTEDIEKKHTVEKPFNDYSHNLSKTERNVKSDSQTTLKLINDARYKTESEDSRRNSITKDTVSSHAKAFDSKSPNLKTPSTDKTSPKNTTLRSNEAVKKVKALFENIVSPTTNANSKDSTKSGTKLTDIGVFNTSKEIVNEEFEIMSTVTDSEIGLEIDIAPNIKSDRVQYSKGTYNRPGNHLGNYPKSQQPKSPDPKLTTITNEKTKFNEDLPAGKPVNNKIVLSRYPQGLCTKSPDLKREHFSKPAVNSPPITPSKPHISTKHEKTEHITEETEIVSRRGSGKFGVELRRTSTDRGVPERRRSSTGEPHLQPCIEDIQDLALLEQMLEKVVGYEQRRRIRAQIRNVKKAKDEKLHVPIKNDKSNRTNTDTKSIISTKSISQNLTNERSTITRDLSLDDKKKNVTANVRTYSPDHLSKRANEPIDKRKSPDKKLSNINNTSQKLEKSSDITTVRSRKQSPEKRAKSPVKISSSDKIKSTNYNEYTTAYMKKIGLDLEPNSKRSRKSPVKSMIDKSVRNDTKINKQIEFENSSVSTSAERRSSRTMEEVNIIHRNGTKSPSPSSKRKVRDVDRLYRRSPSPDLKRPREEMQKSTEYKSAFIVQNSKTITNDLLNGSPKQKIDDKPIWATTNVLRKVGTTEPRKITPKKVESDKTLRKASPSRIVTKPTDLITSSYGVGPTDENGKPLFGIRALRHQNGSKSNFEVKGTVVKKEFHSRNGGEPEGEISITAYSSNPEDLTRFLENNNATRMAEDIKQSLHEKDSRSGITSITTTKKFGNSSGNSISKIHAERAAITHTPETLIDLDRKVLRRGSVKSLTEKFIKNAVETTKTERDPYPKAGLILRSGRASSGSLSSSSSIQDILACTENNASVDSEETSVFHSRTETSNVSSSSNVTSSFLNSNTKVSGVQDIITRMKNADIVIQEGDTSEDAEARALLNKFLGATCLMTGMESYVTQKPNSRHQIQETKNRTFSKTTSSSKDIDLNNIWDERELRSLLDECADYERRRLIRARLRQVMAEQEACAQIVADAVQSEPTTPTSPQATTIVKQSTQEKEKKSTVEGSSVKTVTSEKTTNVSTTKETKVSESSSQQVKKPVSPFAKFKQLEKQNSTPTSPSSPKTPMTPGGTQPLFRFTDPQLQASAATIKERLLQWCRDKTKDYENVKLDNFSTSWSDGLAFCALIHHFLPDAFDYSQLTAEKRRHNFTLAFKVADEKAGIFPLLDVDDMVTMRKPDWKCVFTYVQAIHRRFKDD